MDKRLQFSTEHYKQKLNDYAKDTIDFESFNEMFKYKVNKNDNPTVVEVFEDYYKIYISEKPKVTLWITRPNNYDFRGSFYAQVYITNQDIEIKVFWNKLSIVLYSIAILFFFGISILTTRNGDSEFPMFLPFLLIFGIYLYVAKKRYKTFIINFLNSI